MLFGRVGHRPAPLRSRLGWAEPAWLSSAYSVGSPRLVGRSTHGYSMGSPVAVGTVGVLTGYSADGVARPVGRSTHGALSGQPPRSGRHKGKFKDRFLGRIVVPIRLGWPTFSSLGSLSKYAGQCAPPRAISRERLVLARRLDSANTYAHAHTQTRTHTPRTHTHARTHWWLHPSISPLRYCTRCAAARARAAGRAVLLAQACARMADR